MSDLLPIPSPLIAEAIRRATRAEACRRAAEEDVRERSTWLAVAEAESGHSHRALSEFVWRAR